MTPQQKAALVCHLSSLQDYITEDINRLDLKYSNAIRRDKLYREELSQVTSAIKELEAMPTETQTNGETK